MDKNTLHINFVSTEERQMCVQLQSTKIHKEYFLQLPRGGWGWGKGKQGLQPDCSSYLKHTNITLSI